jgi:hypothetical protein
MSASILRTTVVGLWGVALVFADSLCQLELAPLSAGRQGQSGSVLPWDAAVVFAGGITASGEGDGVLDSTVDAYTGFVDAVPTHHVVENMSMAKTGMASASTNQAAYFAGGCFSAGEEPMVSQCEPTDVLDVYSIRGSGKHQKVVWTRGVKLSEPKYAAGIGVMWTGKKDDGPQWADTPHILVAGGIVASSWGEGLFRASETVDIVREEYKRTDGTMEVSDVSSHSLPSFLVLRTWWS